MKVAIIMGSTSDLSKVEPAISILKDYGVEVNVRCLSAHRAHLGLSSFIKETETDGTEVITTPGKAAAIPAAVIITSVPSVSVSLINELNPKCARCAERHLTFTSTP